MDNWYLYRHIREDLNVPFYIGIGCKKDFGRAYEFSNNKRSAFWVKITKKSNFRVEILFENLSKDDVSEKEKEFIKIYGRKDLGFGTLCNMTDGGDGLLNCKMSDETRKKISESMKGEKNHSFGKSQSKETIEKKIKSLTGQKRSTHQKIEQSLRTIKSGQAKSVLVYNYTTGEFISEFYAIAEACRYLGILSLNAKASQVCNGKRKRVLNYFFKFKTEGEIIEQNIIIDKTQKKKTYSESGLIKMKEMHCKPVLQFDKDGNFIKEWNSAEDAKRDLKILHISCVCNGSRKFAGGFIWKHK